MWYYEAWNTSNIVVLQSMIQYSTSYYNSSKTFRYSWKLLNIYRLLVPISDSSLRSRKHIILGLYRQLDSASVDSRRNHGTTLARYLRNNWVPTWNKYRDTSLEARIACQNFKLGVVKGKTSSLVTLHHTAAINSYERWSPYWTWRQKGVCSQKIISTGIKYPIP